MTPDEQQTYIESMRKRRLAPVEAYKLAQASKQIAADAKTQARIDVECAKFDKQAAVADKAIAKLEEIAVKLTTLRLMIESEI